MSEVYEFYKQEVQFNEAKTKEAAKILNVSYKLLRYIMGVQITDEDAKLRLQDEACELPKEFLDSSSQLFDRFKLYIEDDISQFKDFEQALEIDPYFAGFIKGLMIEYYCIDELSETGRKAVEKRMENDPELAQIIADESKKFNRVLNAVLQTIASDN